MSNEYFIGGGISYYYFKFNTRDQVSLKHPNVALLVK